MPIKLKDLLAQVDRGYEERVTNFCKLWRQRVQNRLRELMKLTMANDFQIKFNVIEAFDLGFFEEELTEDEYKDYYLFQHKPVFERLITDLNILKSNYKKLHLAVDDKNKVLMSENYSSLVHLIKMINSLFSLCPVEDNFIKRLRLVNPHIFGTYNYSGKVSEINIYWAVIGLCAQRWNVDAEAITITVLAHEYAHAYSHLGKDADGEIWETNNFIDTSKTIKEGLAEYFSYKFIQSYAVFYPQWLAVFEILYNTAPDYYKEFRNWGDASPEVVRYAMLQARRKGVIEYEFFREFIEEGRQKFRKTSGSKVISDLLDEIL